MLTLGILAPYFLSFPVEALIPPGSLLTHSIALAHGLFHLSEIHLSLSFSRKFQLEHKWVSCFVSSSRSYQARDLSTISCVEQQSCLGCTKKISTAGKRAGEKGYAVKKRICIWVLSSQIQAGYSNKRCNPSYRVETVGSLELSDQPVWSSW